MTNNIYFTNLAGAASHETQIHMSHHFTTGGADSSKGDFLPSPSGGPLVRFLGPEFVLCIAQSSHEFT